MKSPPGRRTRCRLLPHRARRGLRPLAGLVLAVFAAAAAADPVRIAGVSHLGDLPTFVAEDQGLFAEAGLDVSVSRLADGRRAIERLRARTADFALTTLTPLVLDRLDHTGPQGSKDPVILASLVQPPRLNQIVTLAGTGIERPADLAGRRLGLTRGTNAEFHWWLFARFHGLDPAAVEVVDLDKEALDGALEQGRIDAAVLWQPWTARLQARVGDRLRALEDAALYDTHWVLVTRRATAQKRARLCGAVLRAYTQAIEQIEHEPMLALERFRRTRVLDAALPAPEGDPFEFRVHLDWSTLVALGQQFDWARATDRGSGERAPSVLAMLAPGPLRRASPRAVNVAADLLETEGAP